MLQKTIRSPKLISINLFTAFPFLLNTTIGQIGSEEFITVGSVFMGLFVVFFYLLLLQMNRRRIMHQKEMLDLKSQYEQTILQSQLEIQEQTFRNISQEIHDNIGQVLSLAKLNLNTIAPSNTQEKILLTEELLGKAITDLRDLSKSLNTDKVTDLGLAEAIRHELSIIEKTTHIKKTSFTETNSENHLNKEKTIVVFRMIQEVFHNIVKHAKASSVDVDISSDEKETSIHVTDNGIGFDPATLNNKETGIGLRSIQQRCALIKAVFLMNSQPGKGTYIHLTIQNT